MKKVKQTNNRLLYSLIALGILSIFAVGVYAATYTASGAGHPYTEISTCGANQVLKMNAAGTAWECGADAIGTQSGVTCSYSLVNCQQIELSLSNWGTCPNNKVMSGLYNDRRTIGGTTHLEYYPKYVNCCSISISCS